MLGLSLAFLYVAWLIYEAYAAIKLCDKEDKRDRERYERWKNRGEIFKGQEN